MNPTSPRRLDGYIRVSQVGTRDVESESYQTEDIQRERIQAWATQRGVEIAHWHVDRDQTGAKLSRPGFDRVMARLEAGETDGVVVAQIDRLSRADVADALMTVRRIHDDYGGTLVALDLGIDPTTEVGEMLLTVLLALARMQWRRYQSAWATARERAARRGAFINRAPLGYRHIEDGGGRLEPDPALGPVIAEAFRLAAGDGLQAAKRHLDQVDPDRLWPLSNVRRMLAGRVYLGEIHFDGIVTKDAHEPLTDLATWTRAQSAGAGRRPRESYPLSGSLRCGTCGTYMVGSASGRVPRRKYRCGAGGGRRGTCEHRAFVDAELLEEYLLELALLEVENREMDPHAHPEVEPGVEGGVETLEEERALLSAQLRREEFAAADLDVSPEIWAARARAQDDAVAVAREEYERALAERGPAIAVFRSDELRAAGVAGVPAALRQLGLEAWVAAGRGLPMPERVTLRGVTA